MAKVIRYCKLKEEHIGDNAFDVCRPSIFGNPYTHIKERKTLAQVVVDSREEAISLYDKYFDKMYERNTDFHNAFDRMYDAYKKFDVLYLGCFCDVNESCHGDIIAKKLMKRSIKEKLSEELPSNPKGTISNYLMGEPKKDIK